MGTLLVTGGAGFIGSTLAKQAISRGWNVRILDNLSTGLKSTIEKLRKQGADIIVGDIRDKALVNSCLKSCDAVVHLAAQVSVPHSVSNPEENFNTNVHGTTNVIEGCFSNNVPKMVMASSAAVYGEANDLPLIEEDAGDLLSPYAESKWENESQVLEARGKGLQVTALRFFNVYGVGQRPDGAYAAVIPKFVDMMAQGITPILNGDGLQTRDFVHVRDVCEAIFLLIEGESKLPLHHVYNVATQTQISLLDLIESINTSLTKQKTNLSPIEPEYGPERVGDIRYSMANIERIKNGLRWTPTIEFQEGIDEIVQERLSLNKE